MVKSPPTGILLFVLCDAFLVAQERTWEAGKEFLLACPPQIDGQANVSRIPRRWDKVTFSLFKNSRSIMDGMDGIC